MPTRYLSVSTMSPCVIAPDSHQNPIGKTTEPSRKAGQNKTQKQIKASLSTRSSRERGSASGSRLFTTIWPLTRNETRSRNSHSHICQNLSTWIHETQPIVSRSSSRMGWLVSAWIWVALVCTRSSSICGLTKLKTSKISSVSRESAE